MYCIKEPLNLDVLLARNNLLVVTLNLLRNGLPDLGIDLKGVNNIKIIAEAVSSVSAAATFLINKLLEKKECDSKQVFKKNFFFFRRIKKKNF